MYTHAKLIDEAGNEKNILTFGPVSVEPKYQRMHYGKALLEASFEKAKSMGYDTIAIFGNPENYAARGFQSGQKFNVCLDKNFFPSAFLVKSIVPVRNSFIYTAVRESLSKSILKM